MAFDAYGTTQQESTSNQPKVDFNEINKYVVEAAQLEQPETLVGYVASIIDLGLQDMPDGEAVFVGDAEDEEKAIAEKPDTYFKDGIDPTTKKPVRLKCWPQKPQQCVTLAIDFPEIIVDKGQFFGESNPLPLRLFLGGQFYLNDVGMVVGRPTPLKLRKNTEGKWSLDKKNLFHKMAVNAKLINADGVFLPQDIDKLLGKAFQFQAQVFFKEVKGKQYYTENIKFVGGLGRGQKEPEKLTEPYMVEFNRKNSDESIKELRAHVVNTIKRAKNYNTSVIKRQIEELRFNKNAAPEAEKEEVKEIPAAPKKAAQPKPTPAQQADSFEISDDLPF